MNDVTFVAAPIGNNLRRIRLKAQGVGVTVVEARLGELALAQVGVAIGVSPAQSPLKSGVLNLALDALRSTAFDFGVRFIQDSRVRANYVNQAKAASEEILECSLTADARRRAASWQRLYPIPALPPCRCLPPSDGTIASLSYCTVILR